MKKVRLERICSVRFDLATAEQIQQLADSRGVSFSAIVRKFAKEGLRRRRLWRHWKKSRLD